MYERVNVRNLPLFIIIYCYSFWDFKDTTYTRDTKRIRVKICESNKK
ncbi:hypothetical protein HMPREF9144_0878 [Prevotella pallens ATCC 700821]|uniref:Uncharacterized protein n=1 Tax=Prevotella pallens ATCC 700821 TaxID=997353 RepID=F9DGT8_9BACT|nr:hypothetical protein HMPREF9144_0878 [Prevotella pallens ATCC 700821]